MELTERLDPAGFDKGLSRLTDMKVSHVWLGYADALFLECGRLKKRKRVAPKNDATISSKTWLKGQTTLMLDCGWRVENRYTVAYGRDFGPRILSHRTKKIVGGSIESVEATGRIPELTIALQNGQVIRTFQSFEGPPQWSIGFHDLALIDIEPEWKINDVSVWLCFKDKSYMRSYCFDEATFKPRKFLRKYGL